MPQEKHELSQNEKETEALYQNYRQLKESIVEWQKERGDYWAEHLTPSDSLPYYSISQLPFEGVLELTEHLLEKSDHGERVPQEKLEQAVKQFLMGQLFEDNELYSRLYMAVSGLLGLARRNLTEGDLQRAKKTTSFSCPVCGQDEIISTLVPPVGKRAIACKLCGHEWESKRVGCMRCGSEDASQHVYLHSEEHPGVEIVVCQECGGSFKEFDLRKRPIEDLVWEDVKTLSLDYAAVQWMNEEAMKKGNMQ